MYELFVLMKYEGTGCSVHIAVYSNTATYVINKLY